MAGWYTAVIAASLERGLKVIITDWSKKVFDVMRCISYTLDVGTDVYFVYHMYYYFDYFHYSDILIICILSLAFILLPHVCTAIGGVCHVIREVDRPIATKCLLVARIICVTPFLPLYYMVKVAIASVRGEVPDRRITEYADLMKLSEALMESLPQCGIQTHVIAFQALLSINSYYVSGVMVPDVEPWQIYSLVSSIFNLSVTVSTNTYLFGDAPKSSRVAFFVCGLMALVSRIMIFIVSGLYFQKNIYLRVLSFVGIFVVSICSWGFKRLCLCFGHNRPFSDDHRRCDMNGIIHVLITQTLNMVYNCFTLSGLLMSIIYLSLAIMFRFYKISISHSFVRSGDLDIFLNVTITLAAIAFVSNILIVTIPTFRRNIGDKWLNIDEHGFTRLY